MPEREQQHQRPEDQPGGHEEENEPFCGDGGWLHARAGRAAPPVRPDRRRGPYSRPQPPSRADCARCGTGSPQAARTAPARTGNRRCTRWASSTARVRGDGAEQDQRQRQGARRRDGKPECDHKAGIQFHRRPHSPGRAPPVITYPCARKCRMKACGSGICAARNTSGSIPSAARRAPMAAHNPVAR